MNNTLRTVTASATMFAAAAFSGMLAGCHGQSNDAGTQMNSTDADKHACKGQNSCKGHGGCKTSQNACKGQNSCKGQGNCKTM
jgi:hypothetical protein